MTRNTWFSWDEHERQDKDSIVARRDEITGEVEPSRKELETQRRHDRQIALTQSDYQRLVRSAETDNARRSGIRTEEPQIFHDRAHEEWNLRQLAANELRAAGEYEAAALALNPSTAIQKPIDDQRNAPEGFKFWVGIAFSVTAPIATGMIVYAYSFLATAIYLSIVMLLCAVVALKIESVSGK